MPLLNQIVALEKGAKSRTTKAITDIYHGIQKSQLFAGLHRAYRPKDEEGETFPAEKTNVQRSVHDELDKAAVLLADLFDIVATKESGNRVAEADVVVDGTVVVEKASVPYLLFLEKELTNWRTMVQALPTLDPSEVWSYDEGNKLYRTEPSETHRARKVPRVLVKYDATDRHPAQTEVYNEDVVVGYWSTTKLSGAVPRSRRDDLIARADKLIDAVKAAREEANSTEVEQKHGARAVFSYLLA